MLHTLRNRLLASYVAILLILLVLIGFILLMFLATRPLPTDPIINDLTAILLDVRIIESFQVGTGSMQSGMQPGHGGGPRNPEPVLEENLLAFLISEAQARDIRALIVTNNGAVFLDSDEVFPLRSIIARIERAPLLQTQPQHMRDNTLFKGRFFDPDGSEWLYVAQPIRSQAEIRPETVFVLVAAPVLRPSINQVFNLFGQTFLTPLIQAGLIGLVIALGLSVLISGSVARPLKRMSRAARHIAGGDYRQRVPVEGPQEVRALATSFNEMAERVAMTQQAQRDFLANVSHDLRTPLTSIQGFSQAIAEGVASDPASAQHAAQIIQDETARLHRMVESLLDLARIEAGKMEISPHTIALSALLQGVGERISTVADAKGVQLVLEIPPDLPRISGDGDRLAQVFINLLDNALEHTPPNGVITLRAIAQPESQPDGVAITVQDTGAGIPAADLSRVFERFYQVDKSRHHDRRSSMGLGLAITKQIVEAHGGHIQVNSVIGQGTVFEVWLPLG